MSHWSLWKEALSRYVLRQPQMQDLPLLVLLSTLIKAVSKDRSWRFSPSENRLFYADADTWQVWLAVPSRFWQVWYGCVQSGSGKALPTDVRWCATVTSGPQVATITGLQALMPPPLAHAVAVGPTWDDILLSLLPTN